MELGDAKLPGKITLTTTSRTPAGMSVNLGMV